MEEGGAQAREDVDLLEHAIEDTFADMNKAFAERGSLDFSNMLGLSVSRFLHRFDAIFSLNQDLLLELNYDTEYQLYTAPDRRWSGCQFPGVKVTSAWRDATKEQRTKMTMAVDDEPARDRDNQPIYKLHGSTHWRTTDGKSMMVVGTGKEEVISEYGLLRSYFRTFREYLSHRNPRLMIVGYSFSDAHINAALLEVADRLKIYLVDPLGLAAFDNHRGRLGNGRNEFSQVSLVGVSTRALSLTFGGNDPLSFRSFERFLAR